MSLKVEALSLVVINIEASNHLPEVIAFLRAAKPDVVLMQEVFAPDLALFGRALDITTSRFVPMCKKPYDPRLNFDAGWQNWGLAILSKPPISKFEGVYYGGDRENTPHFDEFDESDMDRVRKGVAKVTVEHESGTFDFVDTHLTWTPNGYPSQVQLQDFKRFMAALERYQQFTLGGDFNTPRGGYLWTALAERYQDSIPSEITTTIDGNNHRAGHLRLVVDGLFTTDQYRADRVRVIDGLSDHCAITAEIRKIN